jgi:nucleotide-binding universal stress UspA family protein
MFNTIAVGTDGTETAEKALDVAIDIAERYGARLLVFSAYTPVSDRDLAKARASVPDDMQWAIHANEQVDATLEKATGRVRERGITTAGVARRGDPAEVICELAAEQDVDLIVIGNKGMNKRVFGSVPRSICQHAPCSVVVAKTT